MQIKIISQLNEKFIDDWFGLYLKGNSTFFDNPYWIINQKENTSDYHIITVWNNGSLLCVLPLKISNIKFFHKQIKVLNHCNSILSDYKGILFDNTVCKAKLAKLIAKEIFSFKLWEYIDYRDIDAQNSLLNSIFFGVDNHNHVFSSKVIDEVVVKTTVSDFKLPKKMKWEVNNSKKKLEQNGDLKVKHTRNIEKEKILELLKLRASVYEENNDLSQLEDMYNFVEMIGSENLKNDVIYSEVVLNDIVISQHVGFIHNSEFYYYMPIFDREYSSFSPGKVLLCDLINYCKDNDIKLFNFLRGGESYKWNWAEITSFNYSFFASHKKGSFYPKVFCLAHKIKDIVRVIK